MTSAISTLGSFYIFMGLAAALAFASLASYLLLEFRGPRGIVLEATPSRLRLLKR